MEKIYDTYYGIKTDNLIIQENHELEDDSSLSEDFSPEEEGDHPYSSEGQNFIQEQQHLPYSNNHDEPTDIPNPNIIDTVSSRDFTLTVTDQHSQSTQYPTEISMKKVNKMVKIDNMHDKSPNIDKILLDNFKDLLTYKGNLNFFINSFTFNFK